MGEKFKDLLAGLVIMAIFAFSRLQHLPIYFASRFITSFAILYPAYILGRRVFPKASWLSATAMGTALYLAVQSLVQTAWFYSGHALDAVSDPWLMLGAMVLCHILVLLLPEADDEAPDKRQPWTLRATLFGVLLFACALGAAAFVLVGAANTAVFDSIRTPWPLLPAGTLLAIALTWCSAIFCAWLVKRPGPVAILSGVALFTTTAMVPFIYRLGFGFDGFLHVASEKIILASGTLSPKPLYYMGQYAFTTWFARLADLPIDQVDRWLVPLSLALLVPLALYLGRRHTDSTLLPAALMLLPLAPFVATTPQAFSYVLGLAALLLARACHDRSVSPAAPLLLVLWSAAVHPLAGVPLALIVAALVLLPCTRDNIARHIRFAAAWACGILAACSVPLMFLILSLKGRAEINWGWSALLSWTPWNDLLAAFLPWIGNHFALWPSWASLFDHALPCLLLAAAVGSALMLKDGARRQTVLLAAAACLLFVAWTVLKSAGEFAFLIEYERGNYADRLYTMALLLLVVAALPAVSRLLERVRRGPPLLGAAFLALLLAGAAALSYNALPRNDALVTGHGWSVGQADIEAVRAIDRDAASAPYTVLADQSVSAAAVMQFGFKRYAGDVFFYPIPTGGPLYDLFLRMTYNEPSRDTAAEAGKLGSSKIVYVVLNDYWWNYAYTSETLSAMADNEWTFGEPDKGAGHSVKVYKFDLSKPAKPAAKTLGS